MRLFLCLYFIVFCFAGFTLSACGDFTDCNTCTDQEDCLWCQTDEECIGGGFFGPYEWLSCDDWRYKNCYINGRWYTWYLLFAVLIILLVAGVCALITCLLCNPFTYCYSKWKRRGDYVRWENLQEMTNMSKSESKNDKRRKEMREKYNLS
eukprot:TRINITY_DN2910_c0_g1_i1.p1 TRINITY_DN2910_c0_g1~~TRINITY_DN2910_c0_g1_i1.p1  ORF type:complete len:151 (-),score=27.57 TRINITY_DN2910_c0_g1_i1:211-663(-)